MKQIAKSTVAHLATNFFESKDGDIVLEYLRSITMNTILQPPIDPSEAVYMEGRRSVYADIMNLIETSNKMKAAENGSNELVTNIFTRASNRIGGDTRTVDS